MVLDLRLEDVVHMKKPHPCGGFEWRVVRLGADIGIKCCTCGKRVLLPRRAMERRVKAFVSRGPVPVEIEQPSERSSDT